MNIVTLQQVDDILTQIQLSVESGLYKNKTSHSFSDTIHLLKWIQQYWHILLHLTKHTAQIHAVIRYFKMPYPKNKSSVLNI